MKTPRTALFGSIVLAMLGATSGCSTPSLSPIADAATSFSEDGIVGEWKSDEYRATVSSSSDKGHYKLAISSISGDEIRASLNLELRSTKLGESRYLDLFLAKSERKKLADQYGGLAIPTHQIMRYTLEGNTLKVWMLDADALPGSDGRTHITYTDEDAEVLTAETGALRKMIEAAPADVFGDPMEFTRVR